MITSLINKGVKTTPTDLAKEIIALHGRDGLANVRRVLKQSDVAVTERELETVYGHCINIHNRVLKWMKFPLKSSRPYIR
ncbi:hypothetical protein KWH75_06540 [Morganella morganii]|uniref:hypothetical protein n=1 Tax=Morganella morganii TaxID=582 RepID=UPI0021CE6FDF|nr:hypothetical protein [Morganella morganii]MCU6236725.1 hypothetical protein [Morganella morganii]